MTSFLIVSTEQTKRDDHILHYTNKLNIAPIDITRIERYNEEKQQSRVSSGTRQSIGIEVIKLMQKKLFLKPLQSKTKAVIIEEAHLLTPEAQNALLKILEEPPDHTIILLSSDSKNALLPTIISRCQVLELTTENKKLSEKDNAEFTAFIDSLTNLSIGERLKKAEQLAKDKDQAIDWIANLILKLRENILATYSQAHDTHHNRNTLQAFHSLHTLLKTTNVNPRFAIETTLLSI